MIHIFWIGYPSNKCESFCITGPNPQVTKGTKVVLPFRVTQREFTRAPQKWDIRLHQQDGFNITFQVHIPANALVGLWRVTIETTTTTPGARVDEFRFKDDIYVLFNPFCRGLYFVE